MRTNTNSDSTRSGGRIPTRSTGEKSRSASAGRSGKKPSKKPRDDPLESPRDSHQFPRERKFERGLVGSRGSDFEVDNGGVREAPHREKQSKGKHNNPPRVEKKRLLVVRHNAPPRQVPQHELGPNVRLGEVPPAPPQAAVPPGGGIPVPPPLPPPPLPPVPPRPEEDEEEGPDPLERVEFIYHTRLRLFFLDWRVQRRGWIYRSFIPILTKMVPRVGTVQLVGYTTNAAENAVIRRVLDRLIEDDYALYEEVCLQIQNFFYHSEVLKATNYRNLAMGNSLSTQKRRDAHKRLNEWTLLSGSEFWALLKKGTMIVAAFLVAGYCAKSQFQTWNTQLHLRMGPLLFGGSPGKHGGGEEVPSFWAPRQKAELISTFPSFSIYLEETIKSIPWLGWRLVASLERIKYGNWKTWKWHKASMCYGWSKRVRQHFAYNAKKRPSTLLECYGVFLETGKWVEVPAVAEELESTEIPTKQLPTLPPGEVVTFATTAAPNAALEPGKSSHYHALFMAVSPMVVFANTYENACAAIHMRISKWPNSTCDENHQLYRKALDFVRQIVLEPVEIPDWEESLEPRQKINLDLARKDVLEGVDVPRLSGMLKLDESICKGYPRVLINLARREFLEQGKQTAELSLALSRYWDYQGSNPHFFCGKMYRVFFACGATSDMLNQFVRDSLSFAGLSLIIMGDDTWAIFGGVMWALENDFSRYDRTQHYLLRELANCVIARAGCNELLRYRDIMYSRKVVFKKPRGVTKSMPPITDVNGHPADMRNTGEAATCMDNSIVNAACTIAAWSELHDLEKEDPVLPMERHYATFGLVAKIKHLPIGESTFLKGVFLPTCPNSPQDYPFAWIRLPSFLLKFGKVLTDPRQIVKKVMPVDLKCKSILLGQWLGYGDMRSNWMYVRIDDAIRALCYSVTPVRHRLKEWQVLQSRSWIEDEEWNSFLLSRYKISLEEAEDFCSFLESLVDRELPLVYSHSILQKLWEADY